MLCGTLGEGKILNYFVTVTVMEWIRRVAVFPSLVLMRTNSSRVRVGF